MPGVDLHDDVPGAALRVRAVAEIHVIQQGNMDVPMLGQQFQLGYVDFHALANPGSGVGEAPILPQAGSASHHELG
ncbi:hypothetical protein D3C80_1845590 [compost metagenome]